MGEYVQGSDTVHLLDSISELRALNRSYLGGRDLPERAFAEREPGLAGWGGREKRDAVGSCRRGLGGCTSDGGWTGWRVAIRVKGKSRCRSRSAVARVQGSRAGTLSNPNPKPILILN